MKNVKPKQIELQKSIIYITNDNKISNNLAHNYDKFTLNVIFSFNTNILSNAKKNTKISEKNINYFIDLSQPTSIAIVENNLVVSLGEEEKFTLDIYLKSLKNFATYIANNQKISKINLIIENKLAKILNQEIKYHIEQTIFHTINYLYNFKELKSNQKSLTLKNFNIVAELKEEKENSNVDKLIDNVIAMLNGLFLIKHLANNPANIVTPTYLADNAINLAKSTHNTSVKILNKQDLIELKMNALLAVTKGSIEEPKFIELKYHGAQKNDQKPVVLIGKGITFDSGGISIKPSANMDNMKFDMCGGATVLGIFNTVVNLNLPINLVCLIPSCENMPSGTATKPGDVVTTMSGQTVEIVNTDAEGRLILCDALTYAKQFDPQVVIDIATLTGACVIALGNVASGLYCNDEDLAEAIIKSATTTLDKVWQMPLFDEYKDMLKSPVADLCNIGSWKGAAGSATAAAFLSKFVNYKWAHLDIAGTADGDSIYNANGYKLATGRPFYLLIDYLRKMVTK